MREPDFQGVAKVWKIESDPEKSVLDHQAGVAAYVVHCLGYHPLWTWWMIGVASLRDIEGVPPAEKHYPEAEYEFVIMSIDPDKDDPDPDKPFPQEGIGYLEPPDCVVHFHGVNDEQAAEVCEAAAKTIAHGQSCDSDFRGWWENAIRATVDHYRKGIH